VSGVGLGGGGTRHLLMLPLDHQENESLRRAFVQGAGFEPWTHQLAAVSRLIALLGGEAPSSLEEDGGDGGHENFLVQHGTGSGKSLTMALLAWALRSFRDAAGRKFVLVLLLSDRIQLDQQLGNVCNDFLLRNGIAQRDIRRCDGYYGPNLTKSLGDVASATCHDFCAIVTTKQRFDTLLEEKNGRRAARGVLAPILRRGRVAIVCEEAHRSQFIGNKTTVTVNRLFGAHALHVQATKAGIQPSNISYIGFTATPEARTLRLFGSRSSLGSSVQVWRPVHCFHLGEAEVAGVALDVMANYVRVQPAAEIAERAEWILEDFAQKCQLFREPFRQRCVGMIVCRSRADVIAYVLALRAHGAMSATGKYTRVEAGGGWMERGVARHCCSIFGFFSGACGENQEQEERLNGGFRLAEACSRARMLVVCRKLETGYDDPRLCVMYVDRRLSEASATVQVLSRVNRTAPGKHGAYIVDFCNEPAKIAEAFNSFRCEVTSCALVGKADSLDVRRLACVLSRLGELLEGRSKTRDADAVSRDCEEYTLLCKKLGIQGSARSFLDAAAAANAGDHSSNELVFVDEPISWRLLFQVVPSTRYGGSGRKRCCVSKDQFLVLRPRSAIEARLHHAMGAPPSEPTPSALPPLEIAEHVLVAADGVVEATLRGPAAEAEALFRAGGDRGAEWDFKVPHPVFICTKGRAESALLAWRRAPHCLGQGLSNVWEVPVVVVVEPQEEACYRTAWPGALMLVLPRPAETAIGFTRWVVQRVCTASRDQATGRELRLPFIWMADDLLVAFYRLEQPFGPGGRRALRVLTHGGFREALVAAQMHPDIETMAVTGFLRDRGVSHLITQDWLVDRSFALQKLVLLNLRRLSELGVEYCPLLRKSEDLALCYNVVQRQGGHVLKAQGYCYRAIHLEHGGAVEVRRLCRQNALGTVKELLHGGDIDGLSPGHRSAVEALLVWLRCDQCPQNDALGDLDDFADTASSVLRRQLKGVASPLLSPPSVRALPPFAKWCFEDEEAAEDKEKENCRPVTKRRRLTGEVLLNTLDRGDRGGKVSLPVVSKLSWICCDDCEQWFTVTATFMRQHSGDVPFCCSDVGQTCIRQRRRAPVVRKAVHEITTGRSA